MNKLSTKDRVDTLNAFSEGVGINATSRMAGKSKNTILKLLADVGEACALPRPGHAQPDDQESASG